MVRSSFPSKARIVNNITANLLPTVDCWLFTAVPPVAQQTVPSNSTNVTTPPVFGTFAPLANLFGQDHSVPVELISFTLQRCRRTDAILCFKGGTSTRLNCVTWPRAKPPAVFAMLVIRFGVLAFHLTIEPWPPELTMAQSSFGTYRLTNLWPDSKAIAAM